MGKFEEVRSKGSQMVKICIIKLEMQKKLREENIESQNSSKGEKNSKGDFEDIDKILHQIQLTYKANIEAQQTYLDILKCKKKNINSKYLKMIYGLFTENKANQICFEKEQAILSNIQFQDRLFRRYYARLIEIGIRKISYFWTNNAHLDFLAPYILKITKQIHTIFNDIFKIRNLDQHFSVLKMLFHENAVIQQKIYELLIQEGYILSMDEFYRINGVDLVADQLYEAKATKVTTPINDHSEKLIESKRQTQKNIGHYKLKIGKQKEKQTKKQWAYSKTPVNEPTFYNQTQNQKNRQKIKAMIESIVKDLKTNIEQEKQSHNLEVIQEENEVVVPRTVHDSVHLIFSEQEIKPSHNKSRVRIPKPESEYKRKVNEKKISIELMSYFSNQLKSVISEVQEVDIGCLSDLLMTSESNSKSIDKVFMKLNPNQAAYIHSHKSLDSLKRIREQKKRGKFMEMALKKRNYDSISQMYEELNQNYLLSFDTTSSNKQKFSFRSAPGMYISLPKKQKQFNMKTSVKSDKKQQNPIKKLIIRQNFSKDPLFENELIVNQLATHQLPCLVKKLNITQGNQHSLTFGLNNLPFTSILNKFSCGGLPRTLYQLEEASKRQKQNIIQQKIQQQQQKKQKITEKRNKNIGTTQADKLNESNIELQRKRKLTSRKTANQPNYVIYDRIRRRILLTK